MTNSKLPSATLSRGNSKTWSVGWHLSNQPPRLSWATTTHCFSMGRYLKLRKSRAGLTAPSVTYCRKSAPYQKFTGKRIECTCLLELLSPWSTSSRKSKRKEVRSYPRSMSRWSWHFTIKRQSDGVCSRAYYMEYLLDRWKWRTISFNLIQRVG